MRFLHALRLVGMTGSAKLVNDSSDYQKDFKGRGSLAIRLPSTHLFLLSVRPVVDNSFQEAERGAATNEVPDLQ